MFERMRAGWRLAKSVRKSVSRDRGAYLYPIISGIVGVGIMIFTFLAIFVTIPFNFSNGNYVIYIGAFLIAYIFVSFLSLIFLIGMLIGYRSVLDGQPMTIRESLSKAWEYKKQAFEWAVFYFIVTMIIRAIERRFRGIATILIAAVASYAIAIATFFAIPVIMRNKTGPIETIKESTGFITRNFGRTFGGIIYVDLYTLAFTLGGLIIIILGLLFLFPILPLMLTIAVIAVGVVLIVAGMIFNFTYMNIYKYILYEYMNGAKLPPEISEGDIKASIRRKRGRKYQNMESQDFPTS
ncbi:DUF6159 family protein [Cuniculiplasma sp. SKW4]|uniref:DUF6159 family protein n=1 Tax=Cuniculiplasma sp. SKW4 TaxID=3400171 RepID=UPI003FD0F968